MRVQPSVLLVSPPAVNVLYIVVAAADAVDIPPADNAVPVIAVAMALASRFLFIILLSPFGRIIGFAANRGALLRAHSRSCVQRPVERSGVVAALSLAKPNVRFGPASLR